MNWPRIILDGLSMSLLFNAVAGLGFLMVPQAYSTMFPKEIRQAAAPFVNKKDVRTMKMILYPLYLVLPLGFTASAVFIIPLDPIPLTTYGYGYWKMGDMAKPGLIISLIWIPLCAIAILLGSMIGII